MTRTSIRPEELRSADPECSTDGTSALDPAGEPYTTLRFQIEADPESLDALRHARRALLREEWTLGREPDEPSLEQAVFSSTDIVWRVSARQRERCIEKIAELTARAERARRSLGCGRSPAPCLARVREE